MKNNVFSSEDPRSVLNPIYQQIDIKIVCCTESSEYWASGYIKKNNKGEIELYIGNELIDDTDGWPNGGCMWALK